MTAIGPYTQAYDMKQMYDFSDLRGKKEYKVNKNSLLGIINNNPDFTIFAEIVKKSRYTGKLDDQQADFTIFVPSDNALKQKYSKKFLDSIDDGTSTQIITYSMMNRKIDKFFNTIQPCIYFSNNK